MFRLACQSSERESGYRTSTSIAVAISSRETPELRSGLSLLTLAISSLLTSGAGSAADGNADLARTPFGKAMWVRAIDRRSRNLEPGSPHPTPYTPHPIRAGNGPIERLTLMAIDYTRAKSSESIALTFTPCRVTDKAPVVIWVSFPT